MTAAIRLGPLGGLREVPLVQRGVSVQASRGESSFVTLGGRRAIQRSARAARDWAMSLGQWRTSADVAYLTACADGSIPGPLYLHTQDAALSNLLSSDVAAPCRMGTVALGSVAGTVAVGMAGGAVPMSGVVQQASAGAWSATVPIRQVAHVLSGWASAAGAVVEWRTVTAAGVQVATGTVTAAAVTGGFYGAVSIVPGVTVAGVQVRLSSGSRTVGGLRLVEGVLPVGAVEVRRNLASDPAATTNGTVAGQARWTSRWFGAGGAGSTTLVTGAADGPEIATGVRIPTYIRKAWTTGGGVGDTGFDHTAAASTSGLPVVAGQVYTFSSRMRASRNPGGETAFLLRTSFHDATGALIEPAHTAATALVAGSWARLSTSLTAPAGAVTASFASDVVGGGSWLAGDTLDGTGLLVERSASLGTYFDGATSPDLALLPSWTGTPNASPSVLKTIPEGAVRPGWAPGVGVPQVVVGDPQQTLQLATTTEVRSDYTVTLREVG